ncbi:MAG TPA: hypothetical protein ENL08_04900 [Bacteroidetes bacterium]|nr:hypothetical protein [Bacteroidota bacterium]
MAVSKNALQPWRKLDAAYSKSGSMVFSLSAASESTIILDLQNAEMGFLDVTLFGPSGANALDDCKLVIRPAYLDEDGVLQDSGATDVTVASGIDFSAGGVVAGPYSLTQAIASAASNENFLHGAGIVLGLTNVAGGGGETGDVTLQVGYR